MAFQKWNNRGCSCDEEDPQNDRGKYKPSELANRPAILFVVETLLVDCFFPRHSSSVELGHIPPESFPNAAYHCSNPPVVLCGLTGIQTTPLYYLDCQLRWFARRVEFGVPLQANSANPKNYS